MASISAGASGGLLIGTGPSAPIYFNASASVGAGKPASDVVISSSGNVGIGTVTPSNAHTLHVVGHFLLQRSNQPYLELDSTGSQAGGAGYLRFKKQGSVKYSLYNDMWNNGLQNFAITDNVANAVRIAIDPLGYVGIGTTSPASRLDVANGCITGAMCSDIRLKKNISPLASGGSFLAKVMGLEPVTFEWMHRDDGKRHIGLIAQQVETVLPEVVSTPDGDVAQKGLSCTGLNAVLVGAVKELKQDNDGLRRRLEAQQERIGKVGILAGRIDTLEAKLARLGL